MKCTPVELRQAGEITTNDNALEAPPIVLPAGIAGEFDQAFDIRDGRLGALCGERTDCSR